MVLYQCRKGQPTEGVTTMKNLMATTDWTIKLACDCSVCVYDARKCKLYESNPNDTVEYISEQMRDLAEEMEWTDLQEASCYLASAILTALGKVEGFGGCDELATYERYRKLSYRPSWQLLSWLL